LGEIATGTIRADMSGKDEGWFRVQLGSQWIILIPRPRHFGGRQKNEKWLRDHVRNDS
jgi:hypothetical protein